MILKIVFDTNIYISAFVIPGGNAEKAYLHAINNDFELYTSIAILTELARKLEEKFGWEKQKIAQLITSITKVANVLKTTPRIKVLSDEPDNRILECASETKADLLITGDKHLLKIQHYENFKIIKLSDFLMMFERTSGKTE
jgi:putative PIN family toxin of toxin-antitoxin system